MSQPALVGTPATATGTTSLAPAWSGDQPRTAGHLLTALVACQAGSSNTPSVATPAGWTQRSDSGSIVNGTQAGRVYIFEKLAAGSDAAPSFTVTNGSGSGVMLLESANTTNPITTDGVWTPGSRAGSAGAVSTANALSGSHDSDIILAVCGGRGSTGHTWSAPFTKVGSDITFTNGGMSVAVAIVTSFTSVTPTDTVTANSASGIDAVAYQGGAAAISGTAAMTSASSLSGSATVSATVRKVNVAGVATTATRKVNVAGVATTAARRVNVAGVAV